MVRSTGTREYHLVQPRWQCRPPSRFDTKTVRKMGHMCMGKASCKIMEKRLFQPSKEPRARVIEDSAGETRCWSGGKVEIGEETMRTSLKIR